MRFGTFNVRYDNPEDGPDTWSARRPHVSSLLARLAPDVFGLQEAKIHQVEQIHEDLRPLGYEWYGVGRDDGKRGGELNPVFYRSPGVRRGAAGTFWLSETPDVPGSRMPGADFPRVVSWCELRAGGGRPFFFLCTHFDYRADTPAQGRSADLVLAVVPRVVGLYPSVLVGDLNAAPGSYVARRLASSFYVDTQIAAAALAPGAHVHPDAATFTGFDEGGRTEPGNGPIGQTIDYVFVSGFRLERREVCLDVRPDGGRRISDHRPVVIDASICV